jgi:hypothetical protein
VNRVHYGLVIRDEQGCKLGVWGTGCKPLRKAHRSKVTPDMNKLIRWVFELHPDAVCIEVAPWCSDIEQAPAILIAQKTEEMRAISPNALLFSFPGSEVEE